MKKDLQIAKKLRWLANRIEEAQVGRRRTKTWGSSKSVKQDRKSSKTKLRQRKDED